MSYVIVVLPQTFINHCYLGMQTATLSRTSSTASISSTDDAARCTRKRLSTVQLMLLEQLFHRASHPTREEREAFANATGMYVTCSSGSSLSFLVLNSLIAHRYHLAAHATLFIVYIMRRRVSLCIYIFRPTEDYLSSNSRTTQPCDAELKRHLRTDSKKMYHYSRALDLRQRIAAMLSYDTWADYITE